MLLDQEKRSVREEAEEVYLDSRGNSDISVYFIRAIRG